MEYQGKSRRLRERMRLAIPVRVHCRESAEHDWVELSRLIDITPFGARFSLVRLTEPGRLLHLTLPMPRQLRCFDHVEDQYRVWALVRNLSFHRAAAEQKVEAAQGSNPRFEVGVAFTGKYPPASYHDDPSTRYEVDSVSPDSRLWMLKEVTENEDERAERSKDTRLPVPISVLVEVFDTRGEVEAREQTVTENISRRGAAVWTTLQVERGRYVRLTSTDHGLAVLAVVRANRTGADGIGRLHLEFMDRQWPLEGVE